MATEAAERAQVEFLAHRHIAHGDHGGVQLSWQQDGWEIEIDFGPDGKIHSVLVTKEDRP